MQHCAAVGLAIAAQWRGRRGVIDLGRRAPRLLQLDEPHLREWVESHHRGAVQLERRMRLMHHAIVRALSAEVNPCCAASC
jgi:hypothetical protein